jgi:hypothetical protein
MLKNECRIKLSILASPSPVWGKAGIGVVAPTTKAVGSIYLYNFANPANLGDSLEKVGKRSVTFYG